MEALGRSATREPHFWLSPGLQLLRIVRVPVVDGQLIRHSGLAVGGQHEMACHWERTVMVIAHSLLLWARARIAPCPEQDRSWRRRFEVRRTKSVFVLSSWHRGPPNYQHTALKKSFLKGRLARTVTARDDKRRAALNASIHPSSPVSQSIRNKFDGRSKVSALPSPCGLSRSVNSYLFRRKLMSGLANCYGQSKCYRSALQPEMHRDSPSPICAGSSTAAL